jgi:hypothetical protein
VQIERNRQALFAGHLAIPLNLIIQCRLRTHGICLAQFPPAVTPLCSTTTLRGNLAATERPLAMSTRFMF